MSIFNAINTSSTGLSAERTRMDIISKNISNANVTRTASGAPYRRQMVVFQEKGPSFKEVMSQVVNGEIKDYDDKEKGVKITQVVEDKTPFKKIYNPGHPDADENGYVLMPNVEIIQEMVDMITASRGYEANVAAVNASKSMAMKALEIGR
jgi:flagellar basal-body rod protein FlgC